MAQFGAGVTVKNVGREDGYTQILNSAIVIGDIGKAVSVDGTTANQVKLAADGDVILGVLASFEDRTVEGVKVGTIELCGGFELPVKTGETMVVGQYAQGAGSGEVKPQVNAYPGGWLVREKRTGFVTVMKT